VIIKKKQLFHNLLIEAYGESSHVINPNIEHINKQLYKIK